jgi:PadR family transcriptional regulator AphA
VPATQGKATARLTTTEGAVLALLAIEGERSGYDLLRLVESAIAHVWSPARSGLYAVLPRLAHDGLASRRLVTQSARPDKQLYRISKRGREALAAWLETVEPGARDTLFLKVFVGGLTTPDVLLAHLTQFRRDTEAQLVQLHEVEQRNSNRGHDWFHRQLLTYGIERAELDLAWSLRVGRALEQGPR